jgi:AcrR family transcriptional regulator
MPSNKNEINPSQVRRQQEKQELRRQILSASRRLFLERGYEGFSMRQVAAQIGYSATTLYLYFNDKDDLLINVIDQAYQQFNDRVQQAYDQVDDPQERIYRLGRAYIDFGIEHQEDYQLLFMRRPDIFLKWAASDPSRINSLMLLRQAVSEAVAAGAIAQGDVDQVTDALWAAVHGVVSLYISLPVLFGAGRMEQTISTTLDILHNGLAKR